MPRRRRGPRPGRGSETIGTAKLVPGAIVAVALLALIARGVEWAAANPSSALFALAMVAIVVFLVGHLWWSWQRARRQTRTLAQFLKLSDKEFEHAVVQLFRGMGYAAVEVLGRSGDRGVDVRCRDAWERLIVVQCKRWAPTRRIGSPTVREFAGADAANRLADGARVRRRRRAARRTPMAC